MTNTNEREFNLATDLPTRHPSVQGTARWFSVEHLPEGPIRETSAQVASLAAAMLNDLPDSPELTVGLRHLLEAKDCFVRCAVAAQQPRLPGLGG